MKKYGMIVAAGALSVIVLIAAGMLPVVFASPEYHASPTQDSTGLEDNVTPEPIEVDTGDRLGLWNLWWTGSNAASSTTYSYVPESSYDSVMACNAKLEELLSAFIVDEATVVEYRSHDDEYLRLRDERGRGMDVWHTFTAWNGDWRNWVDAYFDAKTGDVLYFYFSTGCETNADKYQFDSKRSMRSDEAARILANLIGRPIVSIEYSGAIAEPAYVVFGDESKAFRATVICNDYTYDLTDPGNYFDLKVIVTG